MRAAVEHQIEDVTDAAGFAALEGEWRRLFDRDTRVTPFQSWEWVEAWWRHHGAGTPWVLVARAAGAVVGLMPLVITRYRGTPLQQVRWMGAPLSDYQDFLSAPGHEAACAGAFLAHLSASRRRWDLCDLNDVRDGSPLANTLDGARASSLTVERVFHRQCPVIALPPTYAEYDRALGTKMRGNLKRRRKQLSEAFKTQLETVEAPALHPSMQALFRLHNTRWRRRGAMGAFSGHKLQAFHLEVSQRFLERGMLRLHRLVLDGETRAAMYTFQLRRRVYHYLAGFDPALKRFGPGALLMHHAIERAIGEGVTEFDLLRGDESYKYAWKARDFGTCRLIVGNGSWRSRFAVEGHRFERWVEHRGLAVQRWMWDPDRDKRASAPKTGVGGESARLPEPDAH